MKRKETTGPQTISYSYGIGELLTPNYATRGTYAQLRAVRKDPTVSLARGLLISSILAGSWNIEADDDVNDDVIEYMEHILKLREAFIYNCIAYGRVDFGWMPFEKVFAVKDNRIIIQTLKPLLHDMTTILVTPQGHFNGYRQKPLQGMQLDVEVAKCLHMAFAVEAGNFYGMPLLENVRAAMDSWADCDAGAKRYDAKVAGAHWVIHYPPGTSTIDGVATDNGDVAKLVLDAMISSGSVAIPTTTAEVLQELTSDSVADLYAWKVELIDDKVAKQSSFSDRLNYLDKQKVRGLGLPERSILEGQHGTKAEAGTHGEMAILGFEQIDRAITTVINEQLVNQLIQLNFGLEMVGKVRVVCLPLVDTQIAFLRDLYKKVSDPALDVETLRNKLDLPGLAPEDVPEPVVKKVEENEEDEEE